MPLPPKSDPYRSVIVASRGMTLMGSLAIAVPLLADVAMDIAGLARMNISLLMPWLVFCVVPGVIYIICGVRTRRCDKSAVRPGQILTYVQLALWIAYTVIGIREASSYPAKRLDQLTALGALPWIAALILLLIHLHRAGRYIAAQSSRGFEPILPPARNIPIAQVIPPPPSRE